MPKSPLAQSTAFSFHPWVYFLIFLAANILLSYFPLSLGTKLWIGLFGIFLPWVLALRSLSVPETPDLLKKEFLPPFSAWVWMLLAAAALFIRFYKLTTLSVWLNYDDGLWGFFAIHFIHHWDWSLFYQDNSYPSLYAWGLALLFKCFGPSVFTVWLYPALISSGVAVAGYGAARQFLSRSLSFLVVLFLALSFWLVFVGRCGNQQMLTLLAECFLFLFLGRFLRAYCTKRPALLRAALLGGMMALGFYIYISWVAIFFFTALLLTAVFWEEAPWSWKNPMVLIGAFGVVLAPLLAAGLVHNYGRIVRDIGSLHAGVTVSERWATATGYITSLFWGMPAGTFSYQPVWGGLLDPLLGALFFLGLAWFLKNIRDPLCLGALAGLVFFFIPGALTHDVEPFRNLPLIPLLAVVCAAGGGLLLKGLPTWKIFLSLACAVPLFAGVDFYHLAVRYHHTWDQPATWKGYAKPMERYRAFQILDALQREKGPGLVYSNFTAGLCDQTLSVADHAFNAAENPNLAWGSAQWAAVLVAADDKPFLGRQFPDGKAFYLSQGLDSPDGGEMLWVMPVTPADKPDLKRWQAANDAFCCFPGRYYEILRDNLMQAHPAFQGDRFLETCYWEKRADLDFRVGQFKDARQPLLDLEQGLKSGYGAAHIYFRQAMFHLMLSEKKDAELDLREALASPMDLTQSRQVLSSLAPQPSGKN